MACGTENDLFPQRYEVDYVRVYQLSECILPVDVSGDGNLDIIDIVQLVDFILNPEEIEVDNFSDINNDGFINIIDIIEIVFNIINDIGMEYDFRNDWDGEHSFIFIHYHTAVSNSSALWNSNTKEDFITNSPINVHYFFLSEGNDPEQMVIDMKIDFDLILQNMSNEEQNHWNSHLLIRVISPPSNSPQSDSLLKSSQPL